MIITRGSTLGRGCGIVWGVGGARGRGKGTPSRQRGTCRKTVIQLLPVLVMQIIQGEQYSLLLQSLGQHEVVLTRERERQVEIRDRRERERGIGEKLTHHQYFVFSMESVDSTTVHHTHHYSSMNSDLYLDLETHTHQMSSISLHSYILSSAHKDLMSSSLVLLLLALSCFCIYFGFIN